MHFYIVEQEEVRKVYRTMLYQEGLQGWLFEKGYVYTL